MTRVSGFDARHYWLQARFERRDGLENGASPELHRFIRRVRGGLRPINGFFLRAESFYSAASYVEQIGVTGYGARGLHEQSHGESFFALFHRFRGDGL